MKQLKFMIAATAAIGLAGVAQAVSFSDVDADNGKDALSNTGFEDMPLTAEGASVTTGTDSYFLYDGNNSEDNESRIIAGEATLANGVEKSNRAKGAKFVPAAGADAKVLEVNTGTDPLLRTLGAVENGDSSAVDLPDGGLYIDTLVQFTVTPNGDSVTPNADDKLMIYLQETNTVNEAGVVTSVATNLMVVGGYSTAGEVLDDEPKKYKVVGSYEAGKWYRLTVQAIANIYSAEAQMGVTLPAFTVSIDGNLCTFDDSVIPASAVESIAGGLTEEAAQLMETCQMVLSLKQDTTLKAVGFAGEGKVDDIVFSTTLDADPDTLDFTFTWDATITSVQYTIGNSSPAPVTSGTAIKDLDSNTKITIEVTPAAWHVYNGQTEFTVTTDFTETALSATLVGGTGEGSTSVDSFVDAASTATDAAAALGVNNTAFTTAGAATTDDAKAVLTKGLNWAKKLGEAPSYLNGIDFANPNDVKANAYLLNCDPDDVDTIDDQFKFETFSFEIVDGKPVVNIGGVATSWKVGEGEAVPFNGTPVIKGAATPNGAYGDIDANSKFFKAFLVK